MWSPSLPDQLERKKDSELVAFVGQVRRKSKKSITCHLFLSIIPNNIYGATGIDITKKLKPNYVKNTSFAASCASYPYGNKRQQPQRYTN